MPAERTLAAVTGTSRGTVVACFDQLAEAGVLTRRQGAGTYVAGRPSWAARPAAGTVATMLLRRVAEDRETIDLSVSAPGDLRHLPPADPEAAWQSLDGHGLDPAGLPALRAEVARHLTEHQGLPTAPDQLVITAGAQEALWLLSRLLPGTRVLARCPSYPGLAGVLRRDARRTRPPAGRRGRRGPERRPARRAPPRRHRVPDAYRAQPNRHGHAGAATAGASPPSPTRAGSPSSRT